MTLKLKDKVRWCSTLNGSKTAKAGVIMDVVPAKSLITLAQCRSYGLDFNTLARDHESYVIYVASATGNGKGKWYWPRVSHLVHMV